MKINRVRFHLASLCLLPLLGLPLATQAQFTYATNGGAVTITAYTGAGGAVTVPDTVNSLPITDIGAGSFSGSAVTSVVLGSNVTIIETQAFRLCSSLTSAVIGTNVLSIGNSAFEDCTSLRSIIIPDSVTNIGDIAFYNCSSATNVVLGQHILNIGDVAFSSCGMGSVTVPGSVVTLSDETFDYCPALTNVVIQNGCPVVGGYMFEFDNNLVSVTIPSSVTNIGIEAFEQCTGLTNVTIPNSVTSISDYAFEESGVTSVTIPASVTRLGQSVFDYCNNLTNLVIAGPITQILYGLCDADPALASVTLPSTLAYIDDYSFWGCALTSVTIPAGVTNVGNYAFQSCASLTNAQFEGNAPPDNGNSFINTPATVYYLASTMGWGPTFGSRPTFAIGAPPQAGGLGVRTNQFGFTITGTSGLKVAVDATTNLLDPAAWVTLGTNTLTNGVYQFADPLWTNYPRRFYRLRTP